MKLKNILYSTAVLAVVAATSACEGEKDLIIIDGNLPIKTTTLYMVGDATPNGWSIDSPTPLLAEGEDPLVFSWQGNLVAGEMKLCLAPGSFDAPFIRPEVNGAEIGRSDITDAAFQMHAGDPDEKWKVTEAGEYLLTFDLRNWTMSSRFMGEAEAPVIEPILADALYVVGDATPNGWNIDAPNVCTRLSDYTFEYEGPLNAGDFKACTATGSWDVPFVRPAADGTEVSRAGVAEEGFVYSVSPDNKWHVAEAGVYRLTFDLEHWTVKAEYKGEIEVNTDPIESATLFMIGDATPGGWSMDDASEFTVSASNRYIFNWEGELVEGTFKACLERDNTFSCPFLRPSSADCTVGPDGVAASDFVYTVSPDDQWRVTAAGRYGITFDLEHRTIAVKYISGDTPEEPVEGKTPIETSTLIMIGDATPGGWSMDTPTSFTRSADDKYVFYWEGNLVAGAMKACLQPDGTFSCPFIRPVSDGCRISRTGVESPDFVFTTDPDDKWQIVDAGRYRIVFNLKDWTITATFLE